MENKEVEMSGVISDGHICRNNQFTITIPNSLIEDTELSDCAIAVYCILQSLSCLTKIPCQCVTVSQLVYYITGKTRQNRTNIFDCVKQGIDELTKKGIIMIQEEFSKHYVIDCHKLWANTDGGNFTEIYLNEFQHIFKINNSNGLILLKYFITVIGTINRGVKVSLSNGSCKSNVVGNSSLDILAEKAKISVKGVIKYNKLLEKEKLLYIYRTNDVTVRYNTPIKTFTNVYGRYCDKMYIKTFGANLIADAQRIEYVSINQIKANHELRLSRRYKQLSKGIDRCLIPKDIKRIYNYVVSENEKCKNMYKKTGDSDWLKKMRDVSIFEKYGLLKEEEQKNT